MSLGSRFTSSSSFASLPARRSSATQVEMCWASSSLKAVQRRVRRRHLHKDVHAVGILFQHAADAAHLPLDAAEPVQQGLVFLRGAVFVAAAGGVTLSVGTADASTAGAVAASGWAGVLQQQQGFFSLSIKYLLYP